MTTVRVGSTRKFSQGWDKAFGRKKRAVQTKASVKMTGKKKTKAKVAKRAKKKS